MFKVLILCICFLPATALLAQNPVNPRTDPQSTIKYAAGLLIEKGDTIGFMKEVYTPETLETLLEGRTIEEVVGALSEAQEETLKERMQLWLMAIESKPSYNEAKTEAAFAKVVTEGDQSLLTMIKIGDRWFVDLERSVMLRYMSPRRLRFLRACDYLEKSAWYSQLVWLIF